MGLISGALGIAGIEHKDKPIQPQPVKEAPPLPPQFADAASLSDNLKSTITSLQTTLQDWQESILLNGKCIHLYTIQISPLRPSVIKAGDSKSWQTEPF